MRIINCRLTYTPVHDRPRLAYEVNRSYNLYEQCLDKCRGKKWYPPSQKNKTKQNIKIILKITHHLRNSHFPGSLIRNNHLNPHPSRHHRNRPTNRCRVSLL